MNLGKGYTGAPCVLILEFLCFKVISSKTKILEKK